MPAPRRAHLFALGALAIAGCGSAGTDPDRSALLLAGTKAPVSFARLDAAQTSARRFAAAYAKALYDPTPPQLPAVTSGVERAIRTAAARIPPARLGLRARDGALNLVPETPTRVRAAVSLADGRSPPFSVGFTLERRRGRWRVTAISPPG